ncbi:DNA polymerase III subunit gamma and tau [Tessaracoccus flavus]|nr:DNA polymerase III subunit gamma and tau [Tessaracoccus flavus]
MEGPGLFDDLDVPEPDPVPVQDGPSLFADAEEAEVVPEAADEVSFVPPSRIDNSPRKVQQDAPLALYRRYRPDTFADVIGQEHVTVPLQRALANNRVNHAYLFSGPRGCGKTTSARILARCLNCEQGPTDTPCGQCRSCQDLARGGPGSIDVIEIDAASHGGVDDARDLRERAYFAPVASRYKIYIVDEAHMVTPAGFNALLKLVEEPPPHAKFIFATTEPEKVIGTIRSRTHHYPFRLVPPRVLGDYLAEICESEGVEVDHAALPLVVRAGAGSVRDSLSVLDQLLGGASEDGVSYAQAAALLGYTPDALLDEIMDAFAAGDSAGVFHTIDKVIEVGQDPRRFAEDLLRRLRDLIILAAVPEAATNGLLEVSGDQAQRLQTQAAGMGAGELTRAAEVIATGLTEMRGTTAPRLHLELMCARVLLPGADTDERGLHARMDRLERRVGMIGKGEADPVADWEDVAEPTRPVRERPAAQQAAAPQGRRPAGEPPRQRDAAAAPAQEPETVSTQRSAEDGPASPGQPSSPPSVRQPAPAKDPRRPAPVEEPAPASPPAPAKPAATGRVELTAAELRRVWPNVLEEVKTRRRFTYMLLSQHAQVLDVSDGALMLGFSAVGPRDNFTSGGSQDVLADAIIETIGVELRIQAVVSDADHPERRPAAPSAERPPVEAPEPPERREPQEAPRQRPEPARQPEPPAREEPPEDTAISADDQVLDPTHNAEELLTSAFGAEVISVRDLGAQSGQ